MPRTLGHVCKVPWYPVHPSYSDSQHGGASSECVLDLIGGVLPTAMPWPCVDQGIRALLDDGDYNEGPIDLVDRG